jgi:hypothetical protein
MIGKKRNKGAEVQRDKVFFWSSNLVFKRPFVLLSAVSIIANPATIGCRYYQGYLRNFSFLKKHKFKGTEPHSDNGFPERRTAVHFT